MQTPELDFDLVCSSTNERHQNHKVYARYKYNYVCQYLHFQGGLTERGLNKFFLLQRGADWRGGLIERGA